METLREKHAKERQEFKMSVAGVYGNDAMLRQIAESVRISSSRPPSVEVDHGNCALSLSVCSASL